MNHDNLSKAITITTIFVLFFIMLFSSFKGGGDYDFHFSKAQGDCSQYRSCDYYTPLFHWLAGPFAFHENAFFYFVLFLLAFVTPMLLYLITKDWLVTWLYFATTSYFWFFINGIFAQATAMILLLLVVYFKDWRKQAIVVLLAALAHGHGFLLCLAAFICIHFVKAFQNKFNWMKVLPACSGTFGTNPPEVLNKPVDGLVTTGVQFRVADVLIPFTKIFPLPLFIICVWWVFNKKEHLDLFLISIISIIAGFWISHRAFYILPLVLLPILVKWSRSLEPKWFKGFIVLTIIFFIYQLYSWLNYKLVCAT